MSTILVPGQIEASAVAPPFLHLPPKGLFALRAERLELLAEGNALGDYLWLIARLCHLQQWLVDNPPGALPVAEDRQRLCVSHGLPPLAADSLVREGPWLVWLQALLDQFGEAAKGPLAEALQALRKSDDGQRKGWGIALLAGQFDAVPAAVVPFLGAALQAAWSYWLLALPACELKPAGSLAQCPACGSPALAGVVRNRGKHNGLRYLACSLCACEWHVVRVKCVYCESSKDLRYTSLEDDRHAPGKAPLQAECCPGCSTYLKQHYLRTMPLPSRWPMTWPAWRWISGWMRKGFIAWRQTCCWRRAAGECLHCKIESRPLRGKPAPTGTSLYSEPASSLWERACPRKGQNRQRIS